MKRVDANDFASVYPEGSAPLFANQDENGPFARSKVPPEPLELVVGGIVWKCHGRKNAVALAQLQAITGKDERTVKGIVEQLIVTHRMRIGAYRDAPSGYAMIETAEDLAAAVGPYRSQIFAMWRRLRVLLEPHELRALHGQLGLEE